MANRKILIADSSEEFLQELCELLCRKYSVLPCRNGKTALELLRSEKCDMIVLDLMLPGLDGISLLEKAASEDICPLTLAVTPLLNAYVLRAAERLNIRYLVRKPCDLYAVAARVEDLLREVPEPAAVPDPRQTIQALLLSLGLSPKHDGFSYLTEAILRIAQEPDQAFTKVLYPDVGKLFHRSGAQVERSIRNALDAAWKKRDNLKWEQYFSPSPKRPVSAAFITRLAEEIQICPE